MKTELFKRPQTLVEVANWINPKYPIDYAVSEWLDSFYISDKERKIEMMVEEPPMLGMDKYDAYLGAIAEHLSREYQLPIPKWTQSPDRFLHSAWFVTKIEGFKARFLMESPVAFRKRMIFVSSDPLSRASKFASI